MTEVRLDLPRGTLDLLILRALVLTHEIGIRMAVGARRNDVLALVMGQGARLALAGLVAGILGVIAFTRMMKSLLFDVTPTDPVTVVAATFVMIGVVLLACYVPARRAVRIDPIQSLHYE